MGSIRKSKTKRRTRDLDQIHADLRSAHKLAQLRESRPDDEKPGLGQWHCVECSKYLETANAFEEHARGKRHKRRVRMLRETPYTHEEADAAVGRGVLRYEEKRLKNEMEELKRLETGEKPMEVDEEEDAAGAQMQHEAAADKKPVVEEDDIEVI